MRVLNKKIWPYSTILSKESRNVIACEKWLAENMGAWRQRWTVVGAYNPVFYFKTEEDMMWFKLKWA